MDELCQMLRWLSGKQMYIYEKLVEKYKERSFKMADSQGFDPDDNHDWHEAYFEQATSLVSELRERELRQ